MEDTILIFLSGTAGAALIKMIDGIIQFRMTRKATKEDQEEKRAENREKTQDEEIKELKDEIKSLKAGMRVLMLDRIQYLCKKYIEQGYVDYDDRRRLHQMHDSFHNDLDGNGDADILIADVNKLPLTEAVRTHKETA